MKYLKTYEANWLNDENFTKSEILINQLYKSAEKYGYIMPPNRFKFYNNFNDRNRDESEMEYPPIGIETQYGDFFIILPPEIKSGLLGLLEPLLKTPFMGKMYVDRDYNRMVVRINGNGPWLKLNRTK